MTATATDFEKKLTTKKNNIRMINIYDFITDNLLDDITSSNEQVALLYLVRKSKESGEIAPNVQVQKTHIARICHYHTSDRSNNSKNMAIYQPLMKVG